MPLPSRSLVRADGLYRPRSVGEVSYPTDGNDACLQVEDGSYWFRHRNACILATIRRYPPAGALYDVGGGNGFVSLALQAAGHSVVLVEPGSGAVNGLRRGVETVVQSTLADAEFDPDSIDAIGIFDVVEHVQHDVAFLTMIRNVLKPQGLVYCAVPALTWLWSDEDVRAGHYSRYMARSLANAMRAAGLRVEFVSSFFTWLILPVLAFRSIPSLVNSRRRTPDGHASLKADHSLSQLLNRVVQRAHAWELARIAGGRGIRLGTSPICVARRP
jgi:SAM-dependent methyltransferase